MNVDKEIEGIQSQINSLIGTNTKIVRRKKNNEDIKHELFINIITQIELVINRSTLVHSDFKIDLSDYDEMYLQIIDNLIYIEHNKEAVKSAKSIGIKTHHYNPHEPIEEISKFLLKNL